MKICYLVLVYNNVIDTLETLEGILNQDYPDIEVLVVDNNSSLENSTPVKIFSENHNITYIYRNENDGYAGGNNFGWNMVYDKFKYVFVVNNDIIFNDNGLTRKIVEVFENNEQIACVGPQVLFGNNQVVDDSPINKFYYKHFFKYTLQKNNFYYEVPSIIGCFLAIRTEAIGNQGLFDTSFFMYSEELDFCLRIWNLGYRIAHLTDVTASIYHKGGNNPFDNGKPWKFYLSMRNAILCAKNFSGIRKSVWILLYSISCIKSFFTGHFSLQKKLCLFKGLFTGIRLLNQKASSEIIHADVQKALKTHS